MEEKLKTKFGIDVTTHRPEWHMWSFGIGLSHWEEETCLFINFWRWSISIGKLIQREEE